MSMRQQQRQHNSSVTPAQRAAPSAVRATDSCSPPHACSPSHGARPTAGVNAPRAVQAAPTAAPVERTGALQTQSGQQGSSRRVHTTSTRSPPFAHSHTPVPFCTAPTPCQLEQVALVAAAPQPALPAALPTPIQLAASAGATQHPSASSRRLRSRARHAHPAASPAPSAPHHTPATPPPRTSCQARHRRSTPAAKTGRTACNNASCCCCCCLGARLAATSRHRAPLPLQQQRMRAPRPGTPAARRAAPPVHADTTHACVQHQTHRHHHRIPSGARATRHSLLQRGHARG